MTAAAKMRRADKEITDPDELHRILDEALVLHVGMFDGELQKNLVRWPFGVSAPQAVSLLAEEIGPGL